MAKTIKVYGFMTYPKLAMSTSVGWIDLTQDDFDRLSKCFDCHMPKMHRST
jgi:hypothetical protein